ncbi:hypothetical protein [Coxiella burnetii]|uniref:hypothetical protein n=2 Tax=Coxiella burnetii TaxID=777 RepID=UPI0022314EE7
MGPYTYERSEIRDLFISPYSASLHMGYLLNKNARHSGPAARSFKLPPSKESIFPKIDAQE